MILDKDILIQVKRRIWLIDFIFTLENKARINSGIYVLNKIFQKSVDEKHKEFLTKIYRQMHMEFLNSIQSYIKIEREEGVMKQENLMKSRESIKEGDGNYKNCKIKRQPVNIKWYECSDLVSKENNIICHNTTVERKTDTRFFFGKKHEGQKLDFIKTSLRKSNNYRCTSEPYGGNLYKFD